MTFQVQDLGTVPYDQALSIQEQIHAEVLTGAAEPTLLLLEHPPVLTLGANFHAENLHHPVEEYENRGIQVFKSDRGGDVTYHGPGQLVAYPIFPLDFIGRDLHAWLRLLEEAVIATVFELGVGARRFPPNTGVWVEDRKICAMGIKVKRWVSMHGLALNCDADLSPFLWITPCGISDYGVTSLTAEVGRRVPVDEVKPILTEALRGLVSRS